MRRHFLEKYDTLIDRSIPNQTLYPMESHGGKTSELDYGKMPIDYVQKKPFPKDGFIAQFCMEVLLCHEAESLTA